MQMADWLSVLVAHLLRCEDTIDTASERVTVDDLQRVHTFTTGLLWSFSKGYYDKHKKPIPRTSLEAELVQYNTGSWLLEMSIDEVVDFIDWVYNIPVEDLNPAEALDYTRKLLEQTRVHHKVQEAVLDGTMQVEELAEMVNTGLEQSRIGFVEVIDPLADIGALLGDFPANPLGGAEVPYFNMLCQGGIRPGEVATLLGPTGGFKTTMALDVCCAMANVHEYSTYITYEQAFVGGDLGMRICARMANIDKSRCDTVSIQDMTKEEQKRITDAQTRSPYIHFLDRSTACDKVADIGNFVGAQVKAGKLPKLVIIDQLLQWLDSWDEVNKDTIRTISRDVINKLKHEVAEKYGVSVIVLHQLTAALAGGSSTHIPHHSESAECKALSHWADFGIVLGNLDNDANVLWAVASKTRRGSYTKLLVRPEGNICHLRLADNYELSREKKFVPVGAAATMMSPTMSGPKPNNTMPLIAPGDL